MKMGSKRGSAVLEAPEENYALETTVAAEPSWREPAPVGSFQRGKFADAAPVEEEPYVPKRGTMTFRLKAGVPKGLAGRIVLGSAAFLVLGAGVAAYLGMRGYLLHDDRFAVATSSEIEIVGNTHLTRGQILSVFGADLERNIFKVPLAERRADLERLPWVAHATVMRLLPNHLRIAVVERVPVAFVRQGTELGLVDANGVLLDMPEQAAGDPHYSFPVLTGLSAGDPLSVRAARMAVYAKFMKDLDAGAGAEKPTKADSDRPTKSLSEVDVSNPEDVKALVASGSSDILVHFGDEDFLARYRQFREHLPEWLGQYPKLASADMRYERQVVLEMAQGAVVPTNAAPAAVAPAVSGDVAAAPVVEKPVVAKVVAKAVVAKPTAKSAMQAKLAAARAKVSGQAAPVAHSSAGGTTTE